MTDDLGIAWFRRDLRLDDNPAWAAATAEHGRVLALYVVDPALLDRAGSRRASRLLGDVAALDERLSEVGGRLCVRIGDPVAVVAAEATARGAVAVHANADVTPYATRRDTATAAALERAGVAWRTRWGTLVHPPGAVRTVAGGLSQVFTPFHRVWARTPWEPGPNRAPPASSPIPVTRFRPPRPRTPCSTIRTDRPPGPVRPGRSSASPCAADRADRYDDERNRPDLVGTSELSADLRFGTLSPRTVAEVVGEGSAGRAALVRQLAWRDWYAHLLHATPSLVERPMKDTYAALRWRDDPEAFEAWAHGRTGYPMVDAGMRQLRATGWMHNRVRMLTASFLVKNLLIDWRRGSASSGTC